jgi:hypothetical protein
MVKRNLFRDILRDKNSLKYSMTKFAAFNALILLNISVVVGVYIMIVSKQVDHILIGELIALLLTLLGFKNLNDKKNTENKITNTEENNNIPTKTDVPFDEIG